VLDILIILIIFGLPDKVIQLFLDRKFSRKAIILHSINIVVTIAVISFSFIKPNAFNTNQIRLIKFQNEQKKLAASVRSLAILPFSNFTGTESHASLVSGLHDALISEFGQIGAIRVISRTSTLPYANSQKSIKSIASELKVDAIIETSVLSVNEEIRIQVKLINAVPEQQLCSFGPGLLIPGLIILWDYITRLSKILQAKFNWHFLRMKVTFLIIPPW
jgi:TolB-like protein